MSDALEVQQIAEILLAHLHAELLLGLQQSQQLQNIFAHDSVYSSQKAVNRALLDVIELEHTMFARWDEIAIRTAIKCLYVVFMLEDGRNHLDDLRLLKLSEQRLLEVDAGSNLGVFLQAEEVACVNQVLLLVMIDQQGVCSL